MKRRTRGLLTALATAAGITAGVSVLAVADTPPPVPPAAGTSVPPPAVEDFTHPGAEGITNVKLMRGDGRVLLADCAKPSQIQIWTRTPGNAGNKICFTATSTTGSLFLELADVFAVQTAGRSVQVALTADGASQTLDVPTDGVRGVGEGTGRAPATAVQLTVTG
ncbi:hypothetical protein ACFVVX_36210 [Kitasatospora sp. NPDC058170]|uniref:hypothetical protein n=1 Tax=Kitasatospora sp. NPDC058170 TaxID=3346364 RepID=UPI0036DE725E